VKILIVLNKTYRGTLDGGWWYLYLPLKEMGHDVYFYDTVDPLEKNFKKVIETFKPELIFCVMTGDMSIAPHEPWEQIKEETVTGRTKTFNWFCDDTWRYNTFSKMACRYFNVCSTPEPEYVHRYSSDGYSNIIVGAWHANIDLYPRLRYKDKNIDMSFMGALNDTRKQFFGKHSSVPVSMFSGISQEEMLEVHAKSKIGINLSINENDPLKQTQMKQRMFEVPAGQALLFTQHHNALERFFEPNKEIITFRTDDEFADKSKFLLSNQKFVQSIAMAGHKRFLAEHESKTRLSKIINQIKEF
jgi:spore maturation protein CgeB